MGNRPPNARSGCPFALCEGTRHPSLTPRLARPDHGYPPEELQRAREYLARPDTQAYLRARDRWAFGVAFRHGRFGALASGGRRYVVPRRADFERR
jgi:hypothetical protein